MRTQPANPPSARSLRSCDRNERWFAYDGALPARDVGALLNEIAEDPTGIFWG